LKIPANNAAHKNFETLDTYWYWENKIRFMQHGFFEKKNFYRLGVQSSRAKKNLIA
jgi:hypothetical protein